MPPTTRAHRRLVFCAVLCVAQSAPAAETNALAESPTITVLATRPDAVYQVGEEVEFRIEVRQNGRPADLDEISWQISKDGAPPFTQGKAPLNGGSALVRGSLPEPGFLQCKATASAATKPVVALGGAAVDPERIAPSLPRPADFDAFWDEQLRRLAAVPVNPRLTPVPAPADREGIECFDLQADCIGAPVSGYYSRPGGAKPKSHPARLCVDGAGVRGADLLASARWARKGVISLAINAHGIPNGRPREFYAELERTSLKTYRVDGREFRDTYYFLGMFLRVRRALDFLASQPEWDGRILMIEGGSQGGAQAMAGAALDPRVTFYTAMVTAMCDHSGMVAGRIAGWPKVVPVNDGKPDPAVLQAARYFDMVNFAPRIKGRGYFWVGFIDTTCPPTTVYAAYNQLRAPKEMIHAIANGHALDGAKLWPAVAAVQQRHIDEMNAKR